MADYCGPDGSPMRLMEWATLFELRGVDPDDSWWRTGSVAPAGVVSTVWMGIDHSFGGGEPLVWETMVFGCYDRDEDQWRWPSRGAALRGHRSIVRGLWLAYAARTLVAVAVLAAVALIASFAG